tara:strand:+ start:209 stop:358 length:150 start_codon:yes stop_codon:yes gene_type:complete
MYNNDIEYKKYLANQKRLEELEKKEIKRQQKQLQVEWDEINKQSEVDKW